MIHMSRSHHIRQLNYPSSGVVPALTNKGTGPSPFKDFVVVGSRFGHVPEICGRMPFLQRAVSRPKFDFKI